VFIQQRSQQVGKLAMIFMRHQQHIAAILLLCNELAQDNQL
jgi:hypothetical protein